MLDSLEVVGWVVKKVDKMFKTKFSRFVLAFFLFAWVFVPPSFFYFLGIEVPGFLFYFLMVIFWVLANFILFVVFMAIYSGICCVINLMKWAIKGKKRDDV